MCLNALWAGICKLAYSGLNNKNTTTTTPKSNKNNNFDNGNSKFPISFKDKVQSKSKQKKIMAYVWNK